MTTYIYGGNNVKSKRAPWPGFSKKICKQILLFFGNRNTEKFENGKNESKVKWILKSKDYRSVLRLSLSGGAGGNSKMLQKPLSK